MKKEQADRGSDATTHAAALKAMTDERDAKEAERAVLEAKLNDPANGPAALLAQIQKLQADLASEKQRAVDADKAKTAADRLVQDKQDDLDAASKKLARAAQAQADAESERDAAKAKVAAAIAELTK